MPNLAQSTRFIVLYLLTGALRVVTAVVVLKDALAVRHEFLKPASQVGQLALRDA